MSVEETCLVAWPRSGAQTRTETCSSDWAGAGLGAAAGEGAAAAAGGGVIAFSSWPGQLWVLTPRFRVPARGGALAGRALGSVRGIFTGQDRVRAWPLWPPGWQTRLPTVSTGDRWRLSQRSTRSSLYLMEYQVRKMKKKPRNLRLAARPKYTKRREVTSYSQQEPWTPQSCCHNMQVVSMTAPK